MTDAGVQRRAVFLDRDGVINETIANGRVGQPPRTIDELHILPGVEDALQELRRAGFRLIVVTNQPDVVRGATTREAVDALNGYLMSILPLDSIETCFHDDADHCDCRKPAPGLILNAAARDGIDLTQSFMVGDRWRDIEAGQRAGVRTIQVYNAHTQDEAEKRTPWKNASSLAEAAETILKTLEAPVV
jgi:D-glycero-D-manno-heptose 1,7-bisphosphate phosphatase